MEEGGVESVVLGLNRELVRAGHSSVVISRGGKLVSSVESDGGRYVALDLKSKNPLTYFVRAARLRRILRELRSVSASGPLIVCAHSRVPAWIFAWANRTLRLAWITYAHGANSVSRYSRIMTRGDLVVAPSRFIADYLLANYPDTPSVRVERRLENRLRVIPNAVDLERFDPDRLDRGFVAARRAEWGVEPGDFVVMAVGRITALKGFDAVIRDFAGRLPTQPNTRLVIVGGADVDKAELLESLKALAKELGVADRVVFAGAQTKIPECLSIADEVVSGNTTKPESFGLSVAEAYAMNRPVRVLRKFGGVAEIMDAVAAAGCSTLREAVARLYGVATTMKMTLDALTSLARLSKVSPQGGWKK